MKAVGIVVEYNPFHNGHLYHLQQTKVKSGADIVIAIMSGSFLQRGEPALVSKHARTKMALRAGIDLVIELPYAFSTQKAETFARGAVLLLDALQASEVCFGSEAGDITPFEQLIDFLRDREAEFNEQLKHFLQEGCSYPKANALAFSSLNPNKTMLDLSLPNNILGYHYLKAIQETNSKMKGRTIQRIIAGYHDPLVKGETIASATGIRNTLETKPLTEIEMAIPNSTYIELKHYMDTYGAFHRWHDYFQLLRYRVMTSSTAELENIYEAEEGLHHRLKKSIQEANNFVELMTLLKTKRYTYNRLQRYLTHVLTNTKKTSMKLVQTMNAIPYIHILGMNKQGQAYLNRYKKEFKAPLLTQAYKIDDPLLHIETNASAAYFSIFSPSLQQELFKQAQVAPPIRYDRETEIFYA